MYHENKGRGKRKRRKIVGMVSFREFSRLVSKAWKHIDVLSRSELEAEARHQRRVYKHKLRLWKQAQENERFNSSSSSERRNLGELPHDFPSNVPGALEEHIQYLLRLRSEIRYEIAWCTGITQEIAETVATTEQAHQLHGMHDLLLLQEYQESDFEPLAISVLNGKSDSSDMVTEWDGTLSAMEDPSNPVDARCFYSPIFEEAIRDGIDLAKPMDPNEMEMLF